ncbi:type VII secretion protein EccB [Glycomyces sambucus]|uniref:Type VII secretion protein EccB n=1 Tax=Glycomyces sambucus TaxID=380244 RepID=A0A1G9JRT7_9ACTN|nr:type VII secretion protein EccB [Glycomyces sambucus]SDL40310.1 type VII secretion protein EccB [Glycomyces sambucus]
MPQMRSRREQVDAHKFITSRMNQALVLANPDSIERPLRRIGLSIFVSVMVLALVFGGFAIATLFNKGNALPQAGHIITIKGSNSVYVYTTKSGGEETEDDKLRLWQVTNYTSALLLVKPGSDGKPPVQDLKASSIAGLPRGSFTIGIQGIPTQPPDPKELLQHENWNTCSMPRTSGGTASFQLTQLILKDLPEPSAWLGDDHWMLAKTAVDEGEVPDYYLLWNGEKFRIGTDEASAIELIGALELNAADAMSLNESMLNTITDGPPIEAPVQDGFGEASAVLDDNNEPLEYGRPVQSGDSLYTLLKTPAGDQFAAITPTMALVLASTYGGVVEVDPSTRSDVGTDAVYLPLGYPDEDLSEEVWSVATARPAVCAVFDPDAQNDESTKLEIALYEAAPDALTDPAESVEFTEDDEIFSDVDNIQAQTVLPQGTAALADARTPQGATIQGFTYMVSDQGIRHGLVDDGVTDSTQQMLGYADIAPISVPNMMIDLIPIGNDLDPRDARKQMFLDDADAPVYESASPSAEAGG